MGAAIVLRPHDCLQRRLPNDALCLTPSGPNPNPNQTRRRKRSPAAVPPNFQENRHRSRFGGDRSVVVKGPGSNLVMGEVKILRRGEKLDSVVVDLPETPNRKVKGSKSDLALGSTDRLGPEPETVKKQVRVSDSKVVTFAGSTFGDSPPPSSVPVPGFLRRSLGAATTELRAVLRFNSV